MSATFAPIAIVGAACVLPGAHSPAALMDLVLAGRSAISQTPADRWSLRRSLALCPTDAPDPDRSWSDRGGYVTDFTPLWNAEGFRVPAKDLGGLDPLDQWLLHCGREALAQSGRSPSSDLARAGVVVGNLSFPSAGLSRWAQQQWLHDQGGWLAQHGAALVGLTNQPAANRFMSGRPAHLLADALGMRAGAFALDAACASSLYAIRLACDRLQDGTADLMLAGAVNSADDLFIHVGFCALGAISRTGQSRPFDRAADGLVPAEGAALVVLRRLDDAVRDGDPILGVIRGVGLSNDGRGRNFLAPSQEGQQRAIRTAYQMSGLTPADISLVECHATGTPVGDATELQSMGAVFADQQHVPIGSLKSNLGHLITSAGAAGLLKVLGALERGVRPPTIALDTPIAALSTGPFRALLQAEPWEVDGIRRASVSAFGFGGNNAHLLVEEAPTIPPIAHPIRRATRQPLAIVGLGVRAGGIDDANGLFAHVQAGMPTTSRRIEHVQIPVDGLKFPPRDLQAALGQQTTLLAAALEASASLPTLARERLWVLVGMGADETVARYGARWRAPEWAARWREQVQHPATIPANWEDAARAAIIDPLDASGVVGTMPNIPANRLNRQLDAAGPGFTLSAEELSGIAALDVAARGLWNHEADAVLVGAVDLCTQPAHTEAARALLPATLHTPGDAAVCIALMRLTDAQAADLPILSVIEDVQIGQNDNPHPPSPFDLDYAADTPSGVTRSFGHTHAAAGLLHVVMAAVDSQQQRRAHTMRLDGLQAATARVTLTSNGATEWRSTPADHSGARMLRLPAHQPPIQLPIISLLSSSPTLSAVLPLPPTLPRILDAPAATLVPAAASAAVAAVTPRAAQPAAVVATSAPQPAAVVATTPVQPAAVVATPTPQPIAVAAPPAAEPAIQPAPPVAGTDAAYAWAQIANTHHQWIVAQANAQQAFHEMMQRNMDRLMTASRGEACLALDVETTAATAATVEAAVTPAVEPSAAPATTHRPAMPVAAVSMPPVIPVVAKTQAPTTPATVAPAATPVPTPKAGPAATPTPSAPAPRTTFPGPSFDRADLEVLASGKISSRFGELFAGQDQYDVQVRMPEPPMLLADRVLGIDAVPRSMKTGTVWTETDVYQDSWWLQDGRMPPGILIESGQADLLLISWLGIDFFNQGERCYRLLGCELTYHGNLPKVGETLRYDIHVDGHAKHDDVRLFFFHYDCYAGPQGNSTRPQLSVRQGQAGFFSQAELDDSKGVLWDAETGEHTATPRLDPPRRVLQRTQFDDAAMQAFADGRMYACFGEGWERTLPHTRTPRAGSGPLRMLEEVTHLDIAGGPWKRGYLRAIDHISPDDWFFRGHFKNDPCMPGTLMFEGCLHAMAFYLTALGYTIDRDGWRFEPVPEEPIQLRCRGQVVPTSKLLVYEVFVEEVWDGDEPRLYADLLCTVDGRKAFHARRMGLRLTHDWPKDTERALTPWPKFADRPVAKLGNLALDYDSMLACAYGRPSEAFGEMYRVFDEGRRVPRLPGPPYLFMSRVLDWTGEPGAVKAGCTVDVEYDIPDTAWYFDENGFPTMPWCVLLEAALQPCGWLASFTGSALITPGDVCFRNLDGTATWKQELPPGCGVFRTHVTCTSISRSGATTILSFAVKGWLHDGTQDPTKPPPNAPMYEMTTVFGFFPPEALVTQVGLPVPPPIKELRYREGNRDLDLRARPDAYFAGSARLAGPMMCMLDRITGWWPDEGPAGLGIARGYKKVTPAEWCFKVHFYQDPVQPGSLGLEALVQLLQWAMLERGDHKGLQNPRFEPLAIDVPTVWKYRGQVIPERDEIVSVVEILEVVHEPNAVLVHATGSLWCDGLRIYETPKLSMRLVSSPTPLQAPAPPSSLPAQAAAPSNGMTGPSASGAATPSAAAGTVAADAITPPPSTLSLASAPWLADHRPTWTIPAAPLAWMVDQLAAAAAVAHPTLQVIGLRDVAVQRWLTVPEDPARQTTLRVQTQTLALTQEDLANGVTTRIEATLEAWRDAADSRLARFEAVLQGIVLLGDTYLPAAEQTTVHALGVREDAHEGQVRYDEGALFHGPAFHALRGWLQQPGAATAWLDADPGVVPHAVLNPRLLDAITHAIPHASLQSWEASIAPDQIAYPYRIPQLDLYRAMPTAGEVRAEIRMTGVDPTGRHPSFSWTLFDAHDQVVLTATWVEVLLPAGPIGARSGPERLAFLRDRLPIAGMGLSTHEGNRTTVQLADIRASDWLAGTVAAVYGQPQQPSAAAIAAADHVALHEGVHPSLVVTDPAGAWAYAGDNPLTRYRFSRTDTAESVTLQSLGAGPDLTDIKSYWRTRMGLGHWPVEDLYYGLVERFVQGVHITDPAALRAVAGRPLLFVADHQVGIESLLFAVIASALTQNPVLTLAKAEHRTTWLGRLIAHNFDYPGVNDPGVITFFEREDREALLRIIGELAHDMRTTGKSVQVHVEGTRATSSRHRVQKMSSAFIEMAIEVGAPIVPVRFTGGLPAHDLPIRVEFPLGFGKQTHRIGRPILPEELRSLPLKARKDVVIDAINALGPTHEQTPDPVPDPAFADRVQARVQAWGVDEEHATLFEVLQDCADPCEDVRRLLTAAHDHVLMVDQEVPTDRWLAELARRVFGMSGPQLERI